MSAPAVHKQDDIRRFFKAAKEVALDYTEMKFLPDGTVIVINRPSAHNDDDEGTGWEDA